MSTSDIELSPLPPEFDPDHHHVTHFYDDGNLILDVKGKLFQIHKSLLKLKSQTFLDMFSLSHVKGSTDGPVEIIKLHDDPHTFAMLMDVIYDSYSFFRNSGVRQCLEVLELAQKYEMIEVEKILHNHLEAKLPTSAKDDAYEKYQHYDKDPTLAPLVLHVGSLKLIPWAFYAFGINFSCSFNPSKKETYKPPPELLSLDSSYTYPLILLQHIIVQALAKWRTRVCSFYEITCSQSGKGINPGCVRKSRQITAEASYFLSPDQNPANPMLLMGSRIRLFKNESSRHQGPYHNWCSTCINTLSQQMETS